MGRSSVNPPGCFQCSVPGRGGSRASARELDACSVVLSSLRSRAWCRFEGTGGLMISACETEDGVVFDMSELEADALRSYADGLVADPKHPFVELLRSQGLVVGDTPVPHLAVLLEAFSQAMKVLTAWVVAPAGCRRVTFFVGPRSALIMKGLWN